MEKRGGNGRKRKSRKVEGEMDPKTEWDYHKSRFWSEKGTVIGIQYKSQ